MTTRIYANNVKATALANIIADAGGYISFNADGVKVVDTAGLKAYLIAQLELISTTPEYIFPATAGSSLAAARAVSVDALVQQLVDAIGVNHWNTRADWPTSTDVLSGAALVSAVNSAIATCKSASAAVTSYYADINSRLSDYVTAFYYGQGVDAKVTPAVIRIIETRAVFYTHVSDKDEESAPSPASTLVDLDQNDTATYTANAIPTGRNINRIRWYRSRSANVGADYAFVAQVGSGTVTISIASPGVVTFIAHGLVADIAVSFSTTGALPTGIVAGTTYYVKAPTTDTATLAATPGGAAIATSGTQSGVHTCNVLGYLDTKRAEELQEPCPSITWAEPPANMIGMTPGPNGAQAGFFDRTFCVSENFVPYAWPVNYRKTVGWPIVGVGTFGQTYVVLTRGRPYYISGSDSASLSTQPIDSNHACVSRRSIVNIDGDKASGIPSGMVFASIPSGVVFASPDGLCLANAWGVKLITEALFSKKEWQALVPSSIFAAEYDGSYVFHYDTGSATGCYALDLRAGKLTTLDATGTAFFRDLLSDTIYMASGATIKSLFTAGTNRTGIWRSPKKAFQKQANLKFLKVFSDFTSAVTVKLYREGVLTDTKVVTSLTPVILSPANTIEHEVQIESASNVQSVMLTSTSEELRQI